MYGIGYDDDGEPIKRERTNDPMTWPNDFVDADPVTLPHHYARFKVEPVYFIMENKLPFEIGNVIKYVCRYDAKNGLEDLRKARRYLDMKIKQLEGDPNYAR